ncbi:MAG: 2-oxo acid dehydrogenase subunit E2, partial [Hyphomicrobiales bacterium]|nr:2-oxo acid dehydrogenase subunit E2 [Hyphomicrobiales bacterium]
TDKATMEVEAVDEGRIGKIVIGEGTADVPVNEVIAIVLAEGEDVAAIGSIAPAGGGKVKAEPPVPATAPTPAVAQAAPNPAPVAAPAAAPRTNGSGERVFASPLARRIAVESGIDLSSITGSGPHGRIVKRDVEAAVSGGTARPAPRPQAAAPASAPKRPAAPAPAEVKGLYEEGTFDVEPHDTMRKVIAKRLTESKQTIPHFYLSLDCALDNLLTIRKQINDGAPSDADGKPAYKVSVNDFVIKAMAMALRDVPDANVTWTEEGMLKHRASDVGVAVAIPGGLITPVVRGAEVKTLSVISNEMKDFAARARARKLMPEEYQGGTTAISNLGMFGISTFSAVINPPHATI